MKKTYASIATKMKRLEVSVSDNNGEIFLWLLLSDKLKLPEESSKHL
jgi:hypothetical protein